MWSYMYIRRDVLVYALIPGASQNFFGYVAVKYFPESEKGKTQ